MYMLSILIFYTVKNFFFKIELFNVLNIYYTNSSVIIFEDMKIVVAIILLCIAMLQMKGKQKSMPPPNAGTI